jgi:hypothetical protein
MHTKTVISIFSSLLLSSSLYATCHTSDNLDITWTSYKTPLKKGVSGTFDKVKFLHFKKGSVRDILLNNEALIASSSVNSENSDRDRKLWESFFGLMLSERIDTKITAVNGDDTSGIISLNITMNKVSRTVPMRYSVKDNIISAKGVLDLFDFTMQKSLLAINKACFDLHEGKTWSDVTIEFTLPVSCAK